MEEKNYFAPDTHGISYNAPIYLINITSVMFQFEKVFSLLFS